MTEEVVVSLSGGVDSFFTAYILRKKGYRLRGITYILSEGYERIGDVIEAQVKFLDIKHDILDLRSHFKRVIDYTVKEYRMGRTPNPCAFCNLWIKFGKVLEMVDGYVATGHYARVCRFNGKYYIGKGVDRSKSQEYFLSLLGEDRIKRMVLPLGDYHKSEVRARVKSINIPFRKESQGICFIKKDYRELIDMKERGPIVSVQGKTLGYHSGYTNFTVGQRKGSGVSGGERLYVRRIVPESNTVVMGRREEVMSKTMEVRVINWRPEEEHGKYEVSIRYRHGPVECEVRREGEKLHVEFSEPQFAPAPGQIAAFYRGELVVGGGVIEKVYFLK